MRRRFPFSHFNKVRLFPALMVKRSRPFPASPSKGGAEACPACLEDLGRSRVTLGCGHAMCCACFAGIVLSNAHRTTCPLCRGSVPVPKIQSAFMDAERYRRRMCAAEAAFQQALDVIGKMKKS